MANLDLPFPMPDQALLKVEGLPYPLVAAGKVREVFDLGDALLMVATDRVSAFDVVSVKFCSGLIRFWRLFWRILQLLKIAKACGNLWARRREARLAAD